MANSAEDNSRLRPTGPEVVDAWLRTDPRDAGCQQTWELIHVYAEVVTQGGDPEVTMPGITAHLRSCPPCADDYEGLLNALMTANEVAAGTLQG